MRETRGLPIAAYLGMLVALALAGAFVAVLAVVIWLPPRPPDVMRTDVVAEHFEAGYEHMLSVGRTLNESGMIWEVRNEEPDWSDSPYMHSTQRELASMLDLEKDQVRIFAAHVERNDTFVFRVRDSDMQRIVREAQQVAREAQREARRAAQEAAHVEQEAERQSQLAEAAAQRQADARTEAAQELARQAEERALEAEGIAREHAAEAEERAREAEGRMEEAFERVAELSERIHVEDGDVQVNVQVPEFDVDLATPTPPAPVERSTPVTAPTPPTPPAPRSWPSPRHLPEPPEAPEPPPIYAPAPAGVVLVKGFEVGAALPDGRWLVMRQGRNWAEIGWIARAAGIIGGTLLVLSILAVLFARYLTRPIRSFADAVQAVGVNPQSEPVVEEGPRELRGAARAVNTMQARLRALIADRTKTLAAVAHDMRTPLMRLRLAAENAPPEQRERMAKEIGEVEALVASFIAFARDDPAEEARVRLDLSALLQSIADDHAEQGRSVMFQGEERFVITGQSLGLKRLFANLVENALKYGSTARIDLRREDGLAIVDITDDGPGIPADLRETVFEPFVRLNEEGSRGAGLGLAAARSIARAHGGDIVILDAEGGALVRVTLPG
ncbi:MAG: ATP-binding protein [Caulobacteraceae bacterium]